VGPDVVASDQPLGVDRSLSIRATAGGDGAAESDYRLDCSFIVFSALQLHLEEVGCVDLWPLGGKENVSPSAGQGPSQWAACFATAATPGASCVRPWHIYGTLAAVRPHPPPSSHPI